VRSNVHWNSKLQFDSVVEEYEAAGPAAEVVELEPSEVLAVV